MKKQILATMLTTSMVLSLTSFAIAGGSHFHPKQIAKCSKSGCTEEQIKGAVPAAITYLADSKKIDSAWGKAKIDSVGKKEFAKGPEWVVTLKNDANEIRYVFFGLDGYVTGSNSTGN